MTRPVRRALRPALGSALALGLLSAALVGLTLGAGSATAAPACAPTTLKQDIKNADVVFRGMVTKVKPVRGKGDQRTRSYKVAADRVYKSSLVTHVVTVTARVGTRCDVPVLDKGKRYIFFVTEEGSRLMATPATARATQKLTGQVVSRLGDGVVPHPVPPATAQFTPVADAAPPALSRLLAPGAALVIVSLLGLLVVGRIGRRRA